MLYKESLTAHEWTPIIPPNLTYIGNERQWLLLCSGKQKCAFLHVYIACDSNKDDSFLQWNEDLFFLLTQEAKKLKKDGFTVVAMGDFNSRIGRIPGLEFNIPNTNRNAPLFLNFITETSLMIMNTLPITKGTFTRFMNSSVRQGSASLLDYGLIDSDQAHTVTSFVIDEEARYDCGSDHALLECQIVFDHVPRIVWAYQDAIQYNLQNATDYSYFQECLDTNAAVIPLHQFDKLGTDQMLPHLTECLNNSAIKSFGLKVKKKKSGRRLPRHLIQLIQTKKEIMTRIRCTSASGDTENVDELEADLDKIKSEIRDSKADFMLQRRNRLRSKLLLADPTRKKFWRFLKSQIKAAGNITALKNKDDVMVFEQVAIEDKMQCLSISLQYFRAKGILFMLTKFLLIKQRLLCKRLKIFFFTSLLNLKARSLRNKFVLLLLSLSLRILLGSSRVGRQLGMTAFLMSYLKTPASTSSSTF